MFGQKHVSNSRDIVVFVAVVVSFMFLLILETYLLIFVENGSVTVEILLTLSFCGVGGVGWGGVCTVIILSNPTLC